MLRLFGLNYVLCHILYYYVLFIVYHHPDVCVIIDYCGVLSVSTDDKLDCWKSLFTSVVDNHFPLCSVHLRSHSLKWMNDRVVKLMRSYNYFFIKFRRTKCLSDWNKFKLLKKAVIKELWRAKAASLLILAALFLAIHARAGIC